MTQAKRYEVCLRLNDGTNEYLRAASLRESLERGGRHYHLVRYNSRFRFAIYEETSPGSKTEDILQRAVTLGIDF